MAKKYHRSESHDNATNFRRRMREYKRQLQGTQHVTERHVLEIPELKLIKRIK